MARENIRDSFSDDVNQFMVTLWRIDQSQRRPEGGQAPEITLADVGLRLDANTRRGE